MSKHSKDKAVAASAIEQADMIAQAVAEAVAAAKAEASDVLARAIEAAKAEAVAEAVAAGKVSGSNIPDSTTIGGIETARKAAESADSRAKRILSEEHRTAMLADYRVFRKAATSDVQEWFYLVKTYNLYRTEAGGKHKTFADWMRATLDAPDGGWTPETLKDERNAVDYLCRCHAATLAALEAARVKAEAEATGTTADGTAEAEATEQDKSAAVKARITKYLNKNFGLMGLVEQADVVREIADTYNANRAAMIADTERLALAAVKAAEEIEAVRVQAAAREANKAA